MSANNRSTNGHRFVFHSFEVNASERHYVAGEPGVIPYQPPPPPLCPAVRMMPSYPSSISINGPPIRLSHTGVYHHNQSEQYSENSPSPPVDMDEGDSDEWSVRTSSPPIPSFSTVRSPAPTRALSPPHPPQRLTPPPRSPSPVVKLKAGDILYWHHLSRHGEIPGVREDPRARGNEYWQRLSSQGAPLTGDGVDGGVLVRVTGMAVVCGR